MTPFFKLPRHPQAAEYARRAIFALSLEQVFTVIGNDYVGRFDVGETPAISSMMSGALYAAFELLPPQPECGEFICTHKIQAHGLVFYGRPVNELEGNSAAEFDCVEAHCINGNGAAPCAVNRTRFNNGHIVTTLSTPKIVKLAAQ